MAVDAGARDQIDVLRRAVAKQGLRIAELEQQVARANAAVDALYRALETVENEDLAPLLDLESQVR